MKYVWIFILFILTACTVETAVPAPTPLSTQANPAALSTIPIARPTSTTEVTETAVPAVTYTPQPTHTRTIGEEEPEPNNPAIIPTIVTVSPIPTPDYFCPTPGTAEPFPSADSASTLRYSILNFLNTGGNWEELMPLLETQNVEATTTKVDFNGDTIHEIVMSVVLNLPNYERDTATWVFQCQFGEYTSAFNIWWGMYHYDERVAQIVDLTNDGLPEVILEHFHIGSACNYELTILGWKPPIVDYAPSYMELELGCGGVLTIEDQDQDSIKEIVVQGYTVSHLDYAPPREIVQTFQLTGSIYRLVTTEYLPSEYSVNVLDDAQRALDVQDFASAIHSYNQVAHDTALIFISSHSFPPQGDPQDYPSEYQRAFALFRLSILQYIIGESENSAITVAELDATFPEGSIGHEFTVLAHLYMEKRATGLLGVQACQEVTNYIETNYPDLELHIGYWGSNIAWYLNDTICPPYALPGS